MRPPALKSYSALPAALARCSDFLGTLDNLNLFPSKDFRNIPLEVFFIPLPVPIPSPSAAAFTCRI